MAHAEYSFTTSVEYGFPQPGLVSGTAPSDSASTTEDRSWNTISCSSSYSRINNVVLPPPPAQGPIATAEIFYTVSWQYIGGGPPGGKFISNTAAHVRLTNGTSTAERDADGNPYNVFLALAMATTPVLSYITAGHTAYWDDGGSGTTSQELGDSGQATLTVRTTATVGSVPMSLSAYASASWKAIEYNTN